MSKAKGGAATPSSERRRQVALTQAEVQQTRELLESVMTIAAHGILYRTGQMLGTRVVDEARGRGGDLQIACAGLLVERGWALEVTFFAQKAQVAGSLEAKTSEEPTCHILRGLIHAVVAAQGVGVLSVKEEECASGGATKCTFAVSRGGRTP